MGDVYSKFIVAAVQAAPVLFDRDKTIEKAIHFIEEAADKGAVIIGFPEAFISGHTGVWYSAKKSNPLRVQGKMFAELIKNGVKVPSPTTDLLCQAARKAHAYIVMGINEVDTLYPGTVYISQLFISDAGEIIGVHRKLVPTAAEKLIYTGGDGSYLNVYDTPYGKLSALNCGENTHSLYKYALLAMGTQIHIAAWPSFPANIYSKGHLDSVDFRIRQFAYEGKISLISCCSIISEQNISLCCDTAEERNNVVINSGGGSSIVGPNGEYLAGPMYENEGVLTTEISLEEAFSGKQLHNVLGHYTRWDVLSLNFNRKRLSPFQKEQFYPYNDEDLFSELHELKEKVADMNRSLDKLSENLEKYN